MESMLHEETIYDLPYCPGSWQLHLLFLHLLNCFKSEFGANVDKVEVRKYLTKFNATKSKMDSVVARMSLCCLRKFNFMYILTVPWCTALGSVTLMLYSLGLDKFEPDLYVSCNLFYFFIIFYTQT